MKPLCPLCHSNDLVSESDSTIATIKAESSVGSTLGGAAAGAAVGTVIPVIGTVLGGLAGAFLGNKFGSKKKQFHYFYCKKCNHVFSASVEE